MRSQQINMRGLTQNTLDGKRGTQACNKSTVYKSGNTRTRLPDGREWRTIQKVDHNM